MKVLRRRRRRTLSDGDQQTKDRSEGALTDYWTIPFHKLIVPSAARVGRARNPSRRRTIARLLSRASFRFVCNQLGPTRAVTAGFARLDAMTSFTRMAGPPPTRALRRPARLFLLDVAILSPSLSRLLDRQCAKRTLADPPSDPADERRWDRLPCQLRLHPPSEQLRISRRFFLASTSRPAKLLERGRVSLRNLPKHASFRLRTCLRLRRRVAQRGGQREMPQDLRVHLTRPTTPRRIRLLLTLPTLLTRQVTLRPLTATTLRTTTTLLTALLRTPTPARRTLTTRPLTRRPLRTLPTRLLLLLSLSLTSLRTPPPLALTLLSQ